MTPNYPPMPVFWETSSLKQTTKAEDAAAFKRAAQVVQTTESCDALITRLRARAVRLREELDERNQKVEELRRIEAILALEDVK